MNGDDGSYDITNDRNSNRKHGSKQVQINQIDSSTQARRTS